MFVGAFVPWMGPFAPCTEVRVFAFIPPAHIHLVVPTNWFLPFFPVAVAPPPLLRVPSLVDIVVCPAIVGIVPPFLLFRLCVVLMGQWTTQRGSWVLGQVTHIDHSPCSTMDHGLGYTAMRALNCSS